MIQLQKASLNFGNTISLESCDLTLEKGEQVALIGPSGSGKSSLLKVLATEYSLSSGSYLAQDKDITQLNAKDLKALRREIAYIPQSLSLVPNLKVNQNVQLGKVGNRNIIGSLRDLLLPANQDLMEVHTILETLGICEKIFHRTDSLSGGQQQRVAIARALYQKATIILADEPVSAIDPSRAHALLTTLTQLSSKHQLTLACSIHNLEYAKLFFPRLIGLREGKIIFDGKPADFSTTDFNTLYQLNAT